MDTKKCYRCKEIKPASEFYRNKRKRDGLADGCKKCSHAVSREWRHNNVDAARAIQQRWRANNPDKANAGRRGCLSKTCEHCGKGFSVQPSHAAARFCSWACRYSSRNPSNKEDWREKVKRLVAIRGDGECWDWQGYTTHGGYGSMQVGGKGRKAHRLAYELWVGPISDGMEILHGCDNPRCCNPAHLRVGTHAENMHDMDERNRAAIGYRSPRATMTNEQAALIKMEYAKGGISMRTLARRYGLNENTVKSMLIGRTWAKVSK